MEGWKDIQFGCLGNNYSGISGKTKDNFGKGVSYIPYVNVFNNSKININKFDLVDIRPNEKQNKVRYGDILFTSSSETIREVGMTSVMLDNLDEVYLNSFCFGFRLHNFDTLLPEYARYLLRSEKLRHKISMHGKGSTRFNISKGSLFKELYIHIPESTNEQRKIAEILSTIDRVIEQTEELIAKYRNIKQGLMHDLLTYGIGKENKTCLSKLKGIVINSKFKQCYLGDISRVTQGHQIAISDRKSEDGENRYKYITVLLINSHTGEYEYIENPPKNVICNKLDILFTRTGNTGQIVTGVEGVFHNNFFKVNFDNKVIEREYLLAYLNWTPVQNLIKELSGTTTIPDMKHRSFYSIPIFFPSSITEQSKVSAIIMEQNKLIENEEVSLKKYKKIKQGLMHDLLTPTKRVKL